jgi:antitoxin (DNA-binding transcriptional repressor) of toxin-antitoxin stability system
METVAVSKFRSNLMKFLRAISLGEKINITSRGKVIAKLVPPDDAIEDARKKLNEIGKNAVLQDITSPIGSKWDMMEE